MSNTRFASFSEFTPGEVSCQKGTVATHQRSRGLLLAIESTLLSSFEGHSQASPLDFGLASVQPSCQEDLSRRDLDLHLPL